MTKVKLNQESQSVKPVQDTERIEILHFTSGFCRMPDALFVVPHELGIGRWKARFIIFLSYLYALSFSKGRAFTTQAELQKVVETTSFDTVNRLISKTNELFNILKAESESFGVVLEEGKFFTKRGKNGGTQVYLIDQTILAEVFKSKVGHGGTFAFYNVSLLLPISAQAKVILLYLNRKARGGSLVRGNAIAETSTREIAKELSLDRGSLKNYLTELLEAGVIERLEDRRLRFRICRLDEWNRELLLNILHNWQGHPFLKDWKFPVYPVILPENEKSPMASQKNSPIASREISYSKPKESLKSPIASQEISYSKPLRNKYRNKSDNRNKSMEDDAIYNGGGDEKENNDFETLENKEERITTENSTKVKANEENNGSSLSRPNGLKNSKAGAPKNSPAGVETGGRSSAFAVSEEKLRAVERRVKRLIAELPDYVLSRYPYTDDWKSLEKVYSPEVAEFLAKAYQFLKAKTGNFANIRNEVGFIISFVASDSGADFEEFIGKFLSFAGYKHLKETIREAEAEETQIEENSNSLQEQEKEQEKQKEVEQREVEAKEEDARKENTAEGKPKPKKAKKGELVKLILDATEANSLPRSVRKRLNEYLGKAKGLGWADPYSKKCYYVLEEEVAREIVENFSDFIAIEIT